MTGTVAITMAGRGDRFVKAGYDRPKYEIEVLGRPLFDWSMLSMQAFAAAGWRFAFATRAGLGAVAYVEARAKALGLDIDSIVELDEVTDGQATTAQLLAQGVGLRDAPFVVYNIDTFVAPGSMAPPALQGPHNAPLAGWIPCFPAPGDMWSFVKVDADGQMIEAREKVRISDHATVGLYWFSSARTFLDTYDRHFVQGMGAEKGERYVAPMYNTLVSTGGTVTIHSLALEDVGMLGTPEQVNAFVTDPPAAALRCAV